MLHNTLHSQNRVELGSLIFSSKHRYPFVKELFLSSALSVIKMAGSKEGKNLTLQACIHCGSPTKRRCIGCVNAPKYDNKSSMSTFYFSVECQKGNWLRHRTECRKLQARKSLNRAASLLRDIIYKIELDMKTVEITSVHVEDTTAHLKRLLCNPFCIQQTGLFPTHCLRIKPHLSLI
jgi:hypothetical protein